MAKLVGRIQKLNERGERDRPRIDRFTNRIAVGERQVEELLYFRFALLIATDDGLNCLCLDNSFDRVDGNLRVQRASVVGRFVCPFEQREDVSLAEA